MDVDGASFVSKGSFHMTPEASLSSKSGVHLPPVNGVLMTSSRTPNLALQQQLTHMMPVSAAGSGRRKSTPAALDMALRTAEGKAAIEELINSAGGKKQMVFGQYFGNSNKSTSPKPAAPGALTVNAPRFNKASVLAASGQSPTGKNMHSVPEDEDSAMQTAHHGIPAGHAAGLHPHLLMVPTPVMDATQCPSALVSPSIASPGLPSPILMPVRPPSVKRPAEPSQVTQQAQKQAVQAGLPQVVVEAAHQVAQAPSRVRILAMAQHLPNGMARKGWSLSDYSIIRKMYTGYASTVYQATCRNSLEQVALKVYHMENLCELNHYQVFREIRVHASLSHQNIIQLFCAFQEGNDVVLVQQYAEGGDLYRLLHRNGGRLAERQAVEMVLHPFLLSMHYLHTHGIMHRDIKPENVLFTDQRVLKLADFGLAIDLNEERAVTRAGTLDYMAPEVLRCPPKNLPQENKNNTSLHYNNSVDAWAVGVFAYELIVGFAPFAGESQLASVDKIIHSTPEFPEKISELAKSFIIAALQKHPGDRPTMMEMLHHPWIRSYQRRTSVMIPQQIRRTSSIHPPNANPAAMITQHEEGPLPGLPTNYEQLSPAEIETMIARLQMGKHATVAV